MNKSKDFIRRYLSKPNKTGDGYKLYDINKEAKTTTDLGELSEFQNHRDYSIRVASTMNPNCTSDHLDRALNDSQLYVRIHAASNPNATKENLDKALSDDHWMVRSNAAENPNCTKEHITKALNDDNWVVKSNAKDHPNYDRFFPNGH